jgi:hypothetical protein
MYLRHFFNTRLVLLLVISSWMAFAQASDLSHDFDHEYHETQSSCEAFLAFESLGESELVAYESQVFPESDTLSAKPYLPFESSTLRFFSIRAPPKYII